MSPLFAFLDNPLMLLVLGAIAVMLFGERLPEVARTAGKWISEFQRGVRSIRDDIEGAIDSAAPSTANLPPHDSPDDREEPTAPKFEPPEPVAL